MRMPGRATPQPLTEAEQETLACAILVGLLKVATRNDEEAATLGLQLRLAPTAGPVGEALQPLFDKALRLDADELLRIRERVEQIEAGTQPTSTAS